MQRVFLLSWLIFGVILEAVAAPGPWVLPLADRTLHALTRIDAASVRVDWSAANTPTVLFKVLYEPRKGSDGITRLKGFTFDCRARVLLQTDVALVDYRTYAPIARQPLARPDTSTRHTRSALSRQTNVLCAYALDGTETAFQIWLQAHRKALPQLMKRPPTAHTVRHGEGHDSARRPTRGGGTSDNRLADTLAPWAFWTLTLWGTQRAYRVCRGRAGGPGLRADNADYAAHRQTLIRAGWLSRWTPLSAAALEIEYGRFMHQYQTARERTQVCLEELNRLNQQRRHLGEFHLYLDDYLLLIDAVTLYPERVPYDYLQFLHQAVGVWFVLIHYAQALSPEAFDDAASRRQRETVWAHYTQLDADLDSLMAQPHAHGPGWQSAPDDGEPDDATQRPRDPSGDRTASTPQFPLLGLTWDEIQAMDAGQLKRAYQRGCMQHHPDRGGRQEDFVALTAEYEEAKGYVRAAAA